MDSDILVCMFHYTKGMGFGHSRLEEKSFTVGGLPAGASKLDLSPGALSLLISALSSAPSRTLTKEKICFCPIASLLYFYVSNTIADL